MEKKEESCTCGPSCPGVTPKKGECCCGKECQCEDCQCPPECGCG